jgi:hypothetical protein
VLVQSVDMADPNRKDGSPEAQISRDQFTLVAKRIAALERSLAAERATRRNLEARITQQNIQVRELSRQVRSILSSRIWRTLVSVGGVLLSMRGLLRLRLTRPQSHSSVELIRIHCDSPKGTAYSRGGKLLVQGWAVAESGIESVQVSIDDARPLQAHCGLVRQDLGAAFPQISSAASSGFRVVADVSTLTLGAHTLLVKAISKAGAESQLRTAIQMQSDDAKFADEEAFPLLQRGALISVLMPVYNTPERLLHASIGSVLGQSYQDWELCIADDCSTEPGVRKILTDYARKDSRIRVIFREVNGHIAAASNSCLELARGEFVALLDHDDELASDALAQVATALAMNPDVDMVYSDEDKLTEDGFRFDPFFKPDWSPEVLPGLYVHLPFGSLPRRTRPQHGRFSFGCRRCAGLRPRAAAGFAHEPNPPYSQGAVSLAGDRVIHGIR